MNAPVEKLLGLGLYTPAEAALYARVHGNLLSRWLFGDARGAPVVDPQLRDLEGEKVVTFLDFVQSLAIRAIRQTRKVPLQKIREAIEAAKQLYKIDYPFAIKHTTYLLGKEVVIRTPCDKAKFVQLTGKAKRNRLLTEVAELYLEDLSFDANGLANRYLAWKKDEYEIVMDPHQRFGEPLLPSCGYTARALFDAYRIEGGIDQAAKCYGVEPAEVKAAIEYFDHLQTPVA